MKLFIISFLLIFNAVVFSQDSPKPDSKYKVTGNSVSFDNSSNSYLFNYNGDDGTLSYKYSLDKGYSFNGIEASKDGYSFFPSNYGGVQISSPGNAVYYIWSEEVTAKLLRSGKVNDTVMTEWVISKGNEFYYHYGFNVSISEKTLIIKTKDLGKINNYPVKNYADIVSFQLDRCESAVNPVIVGIPYLSTINILYTNNLFTSLFFDWTKTNSSQIFPFDSKFSDKSVYYSQYALYNKKTNGKRNKLDETIYLTVSSDIEDVFPNIPNPVAKYKSESVKRIVYDNWDRGFSNIKSNLSEIKSSGIDNIWLIIHDWQNGGYDNKLPHVLPANPKFGGNESLSEVSKFCIESDYLFSLHENYSDFYPNSPSYNKTDLALNTDQIPIKGWKTDIAQANLLKPTKINKYLIPISSNVHKTFNTNASFIDVITARSPSEYVDYDSKVDHAGKSYISFKTTCDVGEQLRKIHKGPVSGEGYHQFYYIGYYDDFESQIQTGLLSSQHLTGGYYKPLIVDFDLRKMHDKTMVHGVGYLERFFYKDSYWKYMGRSKDSVMILSATELAYGHGAFFQSNSYDFKEQGLLEFNYVYPMQLMYGNAQAVKILYNDNGNLLTLSGYIKKYPSTFDKFDSDDFLSQVYIEYDNGVKVYVNRHPGKEWKINFTDDANGWFDYHGIVNREKILYTGNSRPENIMLPASNGWYCYSPVNPK